MTNWTNITEPDQLLHIPNDNSFGYFWVMILYLVWVVLIMAFLAFGIEVAILSATFIALVASILLVYMGLIAWGWCLFFVGVLLFTILYVVWSSNKLH